MDAQTLTLNGADVGVYQCAKCKKAYGGHRSAPDDEVKRVAEQCCRCHQCHEPLNKGEVGYHHICWSRYLANNVARALAKAVEVTGYTGWVCYEGDGGGPLGDGFAESMDDLLDHLASIDLQEKDWPEFVFCCTPKKMRICVQDIVEMTSELWEEPPDFNGVEELQKALDEFEKKNEHLISYTPDYKHKVRVPKEADEHNV